MSGAEISNQNYTYLGNRTLDRLIRFGIQAQDNVYDNQGRPTRYRDNDLTWGFGRLNTYGSHAYAYNANGIRIRKISGGTTHNYHLEGDKIVRESRVRTGTGTGAAAGELFFMYGLDGITGFRHRNASGVTQTYYYRKNIFGDILYVLDDRGVKVAEYTYDAFGNATILHNIGGVATLNPFRYRGYYFDNETGLYYLNVRYYDPEVGRFISQDNVAELDLVTLNGLNLFAYCGNNPIMNVDPNGNRFWRRVGTILAVAAMAYVGVALITASALLKVVTLGASTKATKYLTAIGIGLTVGVVSSAISQGLNGGIDNINLGRVAIDGLIGGAMGAVMVAMPGAKGLKSPAKTAIKQRIGNALLLGTAYGCVNMIVTVGRYVAEHDGRGADAMADPDALAAMLSSAAGGFIGGFLSGFTGDPNAGIALANSSASAVAKDLTRRFLINPIFRILGLST